MKLYRSAGFGDLSETASSSPVNHPSHVRIVFTSVTLDPIFQYSLKLKYPSRHTIFRQYVLIKSFELRNEIRDKHKRWPLPCATEVFRKEEIRLAAYSRLNIVSEFSSPETRSLDEFQSFSFFRCLISLINLSS